MRRLQGARSAACERSSQDVGARNFPVGTVKFRDAQMVGRPAIAPMRPERKFTPSVSFRFFGRAADRLKPIGLCAAADEKGGVPPAAKGTESLWTPHLLPPDEMRALCGGEVQRS